MFPRRNLEDDWALATPGHDFKTLYQVQVTTITRATYNWTWDNWILNKLII